MCLRTVDKRPIAGLGYKTFRVAPESVSAETLSKDLLCVCGKPTVVRSKIDMRSCGGSLCRIEIIDPKFADLARRLAKLLNEVDGGRNYPNVLAEARKAGLLKEE